MGQKGIIAGGTLEGVALKLVLTYWMYLLPKQTEQLWLSSKKSSFFFGRICILDQVQHTRPNHRLCCVLESNLTTQRVSEELNHKEKTLLVQTYPQVLFEN